MVRTLAGFEESTQAGPLPQDETAGFGTLQTKQGRLPLVALDVKARIAGLISQVTVRQVFRNSLAEPLEAEYIFPLPDRAAVTTFRMKVADRIIEADIMERAQARQEYERALEAGHRAAIAEEDRSGTFSLRVGNIPAGEQVDVELTFIGPLDVVDGEATFRFPLVVAPRYVPGIPLDGAGVGSGWSPDTDQVPDASRVTPPVLLPGFPNPVHLSIEVEIDPAGLAPQDGDWTALIRSSLHSVILQPGLPCTVRLQPDERLNRDFILRFPVAGAGLQSSLLCSPGQGDQQGIFAVMLVPPAPALADRPQPRDVVIVLDRSGSMGGWKMVAARRAAGRIVDTLLEQDRFAVLAFDERIEYPKHVNERLLEASGRNRWQTTQWLNAIDARGGTEMGPALQAAVQLVPGIDSERQQMIVLVTDGQVAGEDAILKQLKKAAGGSMPRVHALGIDQAVNAGFLHRLANLSGGTCDLVESEPRLDAAMDTIHRSIRTPTLTGLRWESSGSDWSIESVVPARFPDVYPGRPVMLFGRYRGDQGLLGLRMYGVGQDGRPWQQELSGQSAPLALLQSMWGRAKVRELEDQYAANAAENPEALAREIVKVSLATHVLSRFTAYVAVDRAEVVNAGGERQKILQPVEMPAGWDMAGPVAAVRCCAISSGPMACMAAPPLASGGRGKLTGSWGAKSAPKPALPKLVTAVRKAIKALEGVSPPRGDSWRKRVGHLIEALEALVVGLRESGRSEAAAVEQLVERGEKYLEVPNSGADDETSFREYLEATKLVLDAIDPPSKGTRGWKSFWK